MDPEALVQCPYDKSHQVRVSRLPYHLVKCQRNNPRVARTLATCPFNARHRVPQAKLRSHVASCPDKRQPDLPHEMDTSFGDGMKRPEVPAAWQGPPCQEDWEAELEGLEDPPPFVLNVRTNDLLLPCDSSAPAAPTSRSRGRGATGHPAAVMKRMTMTEPAQAGRFRGPHRAPATLGGEESSEEASDLGRGETPRVSPPSHGSRGPGGACRVPPPPVWVTRGDPGL
ncbi:gametocyte-specific factor 1 isoform X7 [Ciconia boyciana]|uniref:gametocyte-specific factor 1 isoform X7 n=1 Tax=Ciconia boyciana TaxID=52775 RepID=UPI003BA20C88